MGEPGTPFQKIAEGLRDAILATRVAGEALRNFPEGTVTQERFNEVIAAIAPYVTDPMRWQPIETAPKETTLIVYGAGGHRFMHRDALGQWRNRFGDPRNPPTHWLPLPPPPEPGT